ncbi:MAG: hypothetical protein ACOZCL_09840 [Bacillota bacterium]
MKLIRKPIEVIAFFDMEGNPAPIKFRCLDDSEEVLVVKVEKIIKKDLDKFAGNRMIRYTCESCIRGEVKPFELRYEVDSCRWYLYKV